jgi:hypothetical protein
VCFATTLASGIGTIAGSTDLTAAERSKAADAAKDEKAELARITPELAATNVRPVGATEADIEAAKSSRPYRVSSSCDPAQITATATREACTKFRTLEGELALSKARDATAVEAGTLRSLIAGGPAVNSANPQAAAIGVLLKRGASRPIESTLRVADR